MARISTYAPDLNITAQDKLLGSSYQGKQGNNVIYTTANFKVSDLLNFVKQNVDVTVDDINYSLGDITGDISNNQQAISDITIGLSDLTNQLLDQVDLFVGFTGSIGSLNPDGSILGLSQNFANNLISSVTNIDQNFANNLLGIAEVTEQFANDVLGISTSVAYATADQFDILEGVVLNHTNDIDAINANVITLGTNIDANTGAITSTASDLSLLATRVTVNENTALAIQTDLTTLTSTVNTNTGDITANANDISALGVRVTAGETNVTALQTELTTLTTTVNANTGDISANATDISNLGIVVDTANADIAALDTSLTSLTATVDGNTGDIAVNATNIDTLGTNVETAQADISALDLSLTTLTTTVDGNTGDIATNATNLDLLTTRVTTAEADITAVATDVTTLTTTVDGNTGDIATNASDISILSTSVSTANANITSIQADLTSLETTVDGQTGDIAANASSISALGTTVSLKPEIFYQTTAPAVTEPAGSIWYDTDDGNKGYILIAGTPNVWTEVTDTRLAAAQADITNLSSSITTLGTTVDGNTGNIATNASAIDTLSTSIDGLGVDVAAVSQSVTNLSTTVDANTGNITANADSITALSATVGDNTAAITAEQTARVDADGALSTAIDTVSATVDGNTAAITTNANAIATTDGKLTASYGVHVNAGGKVAGLKLLADSTTTSSFIAQADEFGVEMPNGNRVLTVDTGGLLLNGSGVFTGNISARSGDFGGWNIGDNDIKGPELLGYELILNPVSGISVNSGDFQDSRVLAIRKGFRPKTSSNTGTFTFTNVDTLNFNSWSDTLTESSTDTITKSSYPIGVTGTFSGTDRQGTFQKYIDWAAINGIATTSSDFSGSVEVGLYVQFANYFDFRTSSIIGTEKITSASTIFSSTTLDLPAVSDRVINFVNSQDTGSIYFRFIFKRAVKINKGSVTFAAKSVGATTGLDIAMIPAPFQTDISPGGLMVTMGSSRYFRVDTNSYYGQFVVINGGLSVTGGISTDTILKGSGSFKIDHPLPEMEATHDLVHSFVESPQANNIYRGQVNLVNGKSIVNLDDASGMTEGTFVALNRDIHTFTSNESDWDHVRGTVVGNILTIECQNPESTAKVSWLVIGERHDKHMMDTYWTDENGKVIVEPLKEDNGQNS